MFTIKIENGNLDIEVTKIPGKSCEERINKFNRVLVGTGEIKETKKTDDYFKSPEKKLFGVIKNK